MVEYLMQMAFEDPSCAVVGTNSVSVHEEKSIVSTCTGWPHRQPRPKSLDRNFDRDIYKGFIERGKPPSGKFLALFLVRHTRRHTRHSLIDYGLLSAKRLEASVASMDVDSLAGANNSLIAHLIKGKMVKRRLKERAGEGCE